ncbi:MAG TPA: hypothetical protein VKU85_06165, partial [bacterium]|nr:hypothetical protein [bacterium]
MSAPRPASAPQEEAPAPGGLESALLLAAGASAALVIGATAYAAWVRPGFDHATGSWFVLAYGMLRGELYRPVLGPSGFGGTRWLPLFPACLAVLKWQGLGYIQAAWWINVASLAAIVLAVRNILRAEGTDARVAGVFAVLSVCSVGAMMTLRAFRGDILPVALSVWGVHLAMRAAAGRDRPAVAAAAALLFVAAVTAKSTAVFWPLAVFVSYVLNRRMRLAFVLAGTAGAALVVVLLGIQWASDGRFFSVLASTSAAGGSLRRAVQGPLFLDQILRGSDPLGLLAVAASVLILASGGRRAVTSIPGCLFLSMVAMSALIFGSPGTIENHLVDLSVAAMALWGIGWSRLRIPRAVPAAALLLYSLTMFLPVRFYWQSTESFFRTLAVEHLKSLPGTVLSEHPGLAILAGKHPYVLDTFMLRVLRQTRPEVEDALKTAIEGREYDTVVLSNLDKEFGIPVWYEEVHFGPGFLQMLRANYFLERQIGGFAFFQPKAGRPAPELPEERP